MLPYGRQSIDETDIGAVEAVLRSDWLTTGPRVDAFESALSDLVGGYSVVSCTSGTAALHIAYAAIGLVPGDEVVTTPMTFVATASSASILGATLRFADVDGDTALLDPGAVASLVNSRTKVVAAVDYAGQAADYDALRAVAQSAGAVLLGDAAHSIGGSDKGRPVGDLADVTAFSFFSTKNMTTGEGGAVVCKDADVARRAREFHLVGMVRDPARFRMAPDGPWHQEVHQFGLNYRLTDVACALGLSQLSRLEQFKQRRAAIRARYNDALGNVDGLRLLGQRPGTDPAWHLYPIRVLGGRRREVFDMLRAAGIGVQVNYMPVYWHPVYRDLGYRRGMCPNAEAFYEEEISLPIFPGLTDDDVDRVSEILIGAVA